MKKVILLFYSFYTFVFFSSSIYIENNSIIILLMMILILCVFLFSTGESTGIKIQRNVYLREVKSNRIQLAIEKKNIKFIIVFFPISFILSLYASYFYTGQSFMNTINSLLVGTSNYNTYQVFFEEQSRASFSIEKIPAIISLLIIKTLLLISFYKHYILKNSNFTTIIFMFIPVIYFSISRGTTFEIFEFILMLVYFSSTNKSINFLKLAFFGLIGLTIYNYNISARYQFHKEFENCLGSVCRNYDSIMYLLSPTISDFSFNLFGYFGFGLYYLSYFIDYISQDIFRLLSILIPFFSTINDYSARELCNYYLDCGAMWSPSLESFFINYGFLFSLLFIYLLGFIVGFFQSSSQERKTLFFYLASYQIILIVISLPVGSFFSTSSSNMLILIISILHIMYSSKITRVLK